MNKNAILPRLVQKHIEIFGLSLGLACSLLSGIQTAVYSLDSADFESEQDHKKIQPSSAPSVVLNGDLSSQTSQKSISQKQKIEIIFSGSLCLICLSAFERKLKGTAGVINASVGMLANSAGQNHRRRKAHAIIEFTTETINPGDLLTLVQQNDFRLLKMRKIRKNSQE